MYYDSASTNMYIILIFISLVGTGLGYLLSKYSYRLTMTLYGFLSGLSLVLFLSSLGLYIIGSLWFLYPAMFIVGAVSAYLAYRFQKRLHLDILNQAFLGTYLMSLGFGLAIGSYPNPFIQPSLYYYDVYDDYYTDNHGTYYLAYVLP